MVFCCSTACMDGVVRVFRLEDISSKSFKYVFTSNHYFLLVASTMVDGVGFKIGFSNSLFSCINSRFLRINMPAGNQPVAVAFLEDDSSVVVASQALSGASLHMYAEEKGKSSGGGKQQDKLPLPEIKWEHNKVHDKHGILNLFGTTASYGSADGSAVIASCSEGSHMIFIALVFCVFISFSVN